jgi:hypothetical protein
MLAFMPEPKLFEVEIEAHRAGSIRTAGIHTPVTHYRLKPHLSVLTRFLALLSRTPLPQYEIWMLTGDIPAFMRYEGPLFSGGPTWRIEIMKPPLP